jgi:hypothetical protein
VIVPSPESGFLLLFDPLVDLPPRGEQEVKDDAWELARELSVMSGFDLMSDDFVEAYKRMEGILLKAETYRPHLYLLSLHTVRHLLRNEAIHLEHPPESLDKEEKLEHIRESIHDAAVSIVEMLAQILFFSNNGLPVVGYEKLQEMPDELRLVVFNFETDEEEL